MRKTQKAEAKKIALLRVNELLRQAGITKDQVLSKRYVTLARKIAMKYKLRLPIKLKRQFCKHCLSYWKPGKTVRIRLLKGRKVYYCLVCKHFTRIPYK